MTLQASITRAAVALLAIVVFLATAHSPCGAQGMFSSVFPLNSVETFLGPIFPKCGISSSFRSEVGAGLAAAMLESAKLTGSQGETFNLKQSSHLDEAPERLDIYANLRIWRFGLRGNYWNFVTGSKHRDLAKLEMSGLILGGDFDLVQFEWLAIGGRADFYLLDPCFQGTIRRPDLSMEATLNVKGDRPITVGPYLRYVPPEILGWPVHVEAYLKFPVRGASLTSYGAGLVFRPQIYRFDIAARIYAEDTWLKFTSGAIDFFSPNVPALAEQDWKLNVEWRLYGLDFAVYF